MEKTKKLFEQWEVKSFLEPFDGQTVPEAVISTSDCKIKLEKAVIKVGNEVFSFTNKDYNAYTFFNEIKYLEVDETGEVASVSVYLKSNSIICFYYKNI